jgi:hypothetical protein
MKKRIDFRRASILAGLFALVLIYALLWARMIASRPERTGADFIAFYAAGRVAQTSGAGQVYDADLQQAVQEQQVGFALVPGQVLLYNHLPFLIPVLELLVSKNYPASFGRWALLMLALCAASAGVEAQILEMRGFKRANVLLIVAGTLTFFPLFVSLLNGQDTAILFLGMVLWLAGLLLERDALAGLGLALTVVRPNFALFLAVPFLFRRRRVFIWFCAGTFALVLVSTWIVGIDGMRAYLEVLLATAGGEWYGMKEAAMVNLVGLLRRAAPGLADGIVHSAAWGAYGLGMAVVCFLWVRSRAIAETEAGLATVLAVFTVPHLHFHDLTVLLIPMLTWILLAVRGNFVRERTAALLPLAVSLILLFSNSTPLLKYSLPYLVMALLVVAQLFPGKRRLPAEKIATELPG